MVIVKLSGGLGNQMFQYAAARALCKSPVVFDFTHLNKNNISNEFFTARDYELYVFENLITQKKTDFFIRSALSRRKEFKIFKFLLTRQLRNLVYLNDESYPGYLKNNRDVFLDGYFQDPRYFEKIRATLLNEFSFPTLPKTLNPYLNLIESSNSVAIHVRRGDYLKSNVNAHHGVLQLSYYQNAIKKIQQQAKNPIFLVFSDDINWCKENLIISDEQLIYVTNRDEPSWTEMYLMSRCKHNIIANSTFSWWAAWLNQNTNNLTVAPKNWFKTVETKIIPGEWIII